MERSVFDEYNSLGTAFSKRTIQLLQSPHARVYLALFKTIFPDTSLPALAEDVWHAVDDLLGDLWSVGYRDMPTEGEGEAAHPRPGRAVCNHLIVHYRWLESNLLPDGRTQYRLTSNAIETIALVDRLSSTETVLGASRMRTLVDEISRASVLFSPDYEAGLATLRGRVEQAQRQLDEYVARGGSEPLTEDQAQDVVNNIIELMSHLPSDLRRLEEDVHERGTNLVEEFREDERPLGQIIQAYVREGNRLLELTDHGRSYTDALRVIGDPQTSAQVNDNLNNIAAAPVFAEQRWEQSRRLRESWGQITKSIDLVNKEQLRSSRIISRTVTSHDAARNRELTRVLRDLESAVFRWASQVGPHQQGPFAATLGTWSAQSLRTRMASLQEPAPPVRIVAEDPEDALSFEELRRLGGPLRAEILDAMRGRLVPGAQKVNLAASFNGLPADLRRPAEVAGIAQLACDLALDPEALEVDPYECVDLDGGRVTWLGPRIVIGVGEFEQAREEAHGS